MWEYLAYAVVLGIAGMFAVGFIRAARGEHGLHYLVIGFIMGALLTKVVIDIV